MLLRIYTTYSRPIYIAEMLLRAPTDLVTHRDVLLFHLTHIPNHCTRFSTIASTVYDVG